MNPLPQPIAELVDVLAAMPGAVAVVLGGSRALGSSDAGSDWDLGVYYRGAIDLTALAARGVVHPPGSWGRLMNGGAWLTCGGEKVDVLLRDLDVVEHWTRRAEEGEFEVDALLGYLAGVPTYSLSAELASCRLLRGEIPPAPFPPKLVTAAPPRWRFCRSFSLDYARMHARRGNLVGATGQAAKAVMQEAHAILCERGRWVCNEKRLIETAGLGQPARPLRASPSPVCRPRPLGRSRCQSTSTLGKPSGTARPSESLRLSPQSGQRTKRALRSPMLKTAILVLVLVTLTLSAQSPLVIDRFYQAIRQDDQPALRALVRDEGVNAKDAQGHTPLMLAAAFGSSDAVRFLIANGADLRAASHAGVTALHWAVTDLAKTRMLLDANADVNAVSQLGRTPLLVAASANGTLDVMRLMLAKGADVNAADTTGVTPLIAAANVGNADVAMLLLAHGADARTTARTGQPATPLMGAAVNGNVELVRALLARTPDLAVVSADRTGTVKNGPVPLRQPHRAACRGHRRESGGRRTAAEGGRPGRCRGRPWHDAADVGGRDRSTAATHCPPAARPWSPAGITVTLGRERRRLDAEVQQPVGAGGARDAAGNSIVASCRHRALDAALRS